MQACRKPGPTALTSITNRTVRFENPRMTQLAREMQVGAYVEHRLKNGRKSGTWLCTEAEARRVRAEYERRAPDRAEASRQRAAKLAAHKATPEEREARTARLEKRAREYAHSVLIPDGWTPRAAMQRAREAFDLAPAGHEHRELQVPRRTLLAVLEERATARPGEVG
jgi:hypothetical protein